MTFLRLFGRPVPRRSDEEVAELDEWARHHDDPRSAAGFALYSRAVLRDLSLDQLRELWQEANRLVGQRAPADYGEFLAYGYLLGREDALQDALTHREDHSGLLPDDPSDIAVVDDNRRDPWLTDAQRKQPSPPTKAAIDEVIRQRDTRRAALAVPKEENPDV